MTYKEFIRWCTDRCFDGMWYADIGIKCVRIVDALYATPFWKRKQLWSQLNANNFIVNNYVKPVNQRIEEGLYER